MKERKKTSKQMNGSGERGTDLALEIYKLPESIKTAKDIKDYWKAEKKFNCTTDRSSAKYYTSRSKMNTCCVKNKPNVEDLKLPGNSMTQSIDPEFFQITMGRPIKENKNISDYLKNIRTCFLTRLATGFYLDEILMIEESHSLERNQLDKVRNQFLRILKGFETFLQEDHLTSKDLLSLAERELEKSKEKLTVLKSLKKDLNQIEAEILALEEEWKKLKMFQKFLYTIAPSEWRRVNDPGYGRSDTEGSVLDPCLFDEFREIPEKSITSCLQSKISKFLKDTENHRAPLLYFTHFQQILDILTELEKDNLRALNHCNELDFSSNNALAEVDKVKVRFEQDEKKLNDDIRYLKSLVKAEEEKAVEYEQNLRTAAEGLFRNLITNKEYLSLTVFLEDAYDDAMGISITDPDLVIMIKEIELKYEDLLLALDILPRNIVLQTTKSFYKEQKRKLKEAKDAEKKVHQMETLLKRLSRALDVSKHGPKDRKLAPRSQPPEERLTREKKLEIITENQMQQQFLFKSTSKTAQLYRPLCI